MNGTERAVRWSTIAAVTAIAAVAGWVSYEHALAVVRAYGEAGMVAEVYPVTVDGLIYSASMVLLDSARRGARAPSLARWLLAAGIGATLAANVTAGLHFGAVGAVVAAWPALALVGSYELLMLIIRSSTRAERPDTPLDAPEVGQGPAGPPADPVPVLPATADATAGAPDPDTIKRRLNGHAARSERLFAADLEAGRVPGQRRVMAALKVGAPRAKLVQAHLRNVIQAR